MMGYGREKQNDLFMYCRERQIWKSEGGEAWDNVGGLLTSQSHGDVQSWDAADAHVWVHGPALTWVCVYVHCPCYYRGPHANEVLNHVLRYKGCAELTPLFSRPEIKDPNNPQHGKAGPALDLGMR